MANNSNKKSQLGDTFAAANKQGAVTQRATQPAPELPHLNIQHLEIQPGPNGLPRLPDQPLSQVANDRLLPEDDIASFFKNRAVVSKSDYGVSFGIKLVGIIALAFMIFVCAYNFKPKFAERADRLSERWFATKVGFYIPAFGPRGRAIRRAQTQSDPYAEIKAIGAQRSNLDLKTQMIRSGQWGQIDQAIVLSCRRWAATNDCAWKGYYYAHRNMLQTAKPMLTIPDIELKKLTWPMNGYWYLASAIVSPTAITRQNKFQAALRTVPSTASDMKRIFADEFITALAKMNLYSEIPSYLKILEVESRSPFWRSNIAKWRSLAALSYPIAARQNILTAMMKEDRTALRSDPQILILLTPEMIRNGYAATYSTTVNEANLNSALPGFDRELQKGLLQSLIRLKLAIGQRTEYSTLLNTYIATFGRDRFSNHFNSASQMMIGTPDRVKNVVEDLKGLRPPTSWETLALYGLALIKSGQGGRAEPIINLLSGRAQPPSIQLWGTILKSERFLMQKDLAQAEQTLRPTYLALPDHSAVVDLMMRIYQAQNKRVETVALNAKLGDLRGKTSYWSSPEMLRSPFGPLALIK